jgi:hypothetical protein
MPGRMPFGLLVGSQRRSGRCRFGGRHGSSRRRCHGPHIVVAGAPGSHGFSPTVPPSTIKGEGPTAVYKPSALTVTKDKSGGNCAESSPPASLVLENKGTATTFVTFGGSPLGPLLAGHTVTLGFLAVLRESKRPLVYPTRRTPSPTRAA